MIRWRTVAEAAHGATLVALVTTVVVDPTAAMRSAPDFSGWLAGQQRVDRVMSRVMPPLFLSAGGTAAGATVVAVGGRRWPVAVGRALAAGCIAAAIAVTLRTNEPENARLREWRPVDVPPEDWRAVRARWEQGHRRRQALVAAAAFASVAGQRRSGRSG